MVFDTIIKGGMLVTALDTFRADVGINGEVIHAIGKDLKSDTPCREAR